MILNMAEHPYAAKLPQFPIVGAGAEPPPVVRIVSERSLSRPMARKSLMRARDESDAHWVARMQLEAYRAYLRCKGDQRVVIHCEYVVPFPKDDPFFFDDERCMTLELFRDILDDERQDGLVRVEAAKQLAKMLGLKRRQRP